MNTSAYGRCEKSHGLAMSSRVMAIEVERTGLRALALQSLAGRQRAHRARRAERHRHQETRRTSRTCFPGHQDEYFDLVDPETIRPIDVVEGPVRAALAVWIGKTRLIDNIPCEPGSAQ